MKYIKSNGLFAIVDDCNFEMLRHDWSNCSKCDNAYFRRQKNNKLIYMHHEVLRIAGIKIPKGYVVDHINGLKYDNRLENLRVVTQHENMRFYLSNKLPPFIERVVIKRGDFVFPERFRPQFTVNGVRHRGKCHITVLDAVCEAKEMFSRLGFVYPNKANKRWAPFTGKLIK